MRVRLGVAAAAFASVTLPATGCATTAPASAGGGVAVRVVAAESFWGSIASQIGGSKVTVTSIIANPNTDPHDYEPRPADARTVAGAQLVIVNGVGYDPWADKLVAANPADGRRMLNVGDLVGVRAGGNPHRWYDPANVERVIAAVTSDLQRLDPKHSAYFAAQRDQLDTQGLASYHDLISGIKVKYAGTPVGASESIFALMAPALGLDLKTPASFLKAISEGTEPTPADKATADAQIRSHGIKVYVYNSQNTTPDVQSQIVAARAAGIPVATITETLTPPNATFQQWQVRQLTELQAALAKATRR
jgi:zinc/manganese transport system substrate-binding protein